jgi:hypothetical protein
MVAKVRRGNPESAMLKAVAVAVLLLVPSAAFAATVEEVDKSISDLLGDPAAFHDAFIAIQQAVEDDDPDALAEWVQFPINVRMGDEVQTLKDADDLDAAYPDLFTPEIKSAITDQRYEDLHVTYQGAMFGDGQIWISGICKTDACDDVDVRIITIQDTGN